MAKLWRWVYARTYLRTRRKWGHRDSPEWTAVCAVSLVMFAQADAVLQLASWAMHAFAFRHPSKSVMVLVGLSLGVVNYVRFIRRGDANAMIRKLEEQSIVVASRDEWRLFGFIALSILLPIAISALRHLVS